MDKEKKILPDWFWGALGIFLAATVISGIAYGIGYDNGRDSHATTTQKEPRERTMADNYFILSLAALMSSLGIAVNGIRLVDINNYYGDNHDP